MISSDDIPGDSATVAQFEDTLKRLVDRISKILQAAKCLVCLFDPAAKTLYATSPAIGFTHEQIAAFEIKSTGDGITAEVFRTGLPIILFDAENDVRSRAENLTALGIHNGITVPLIVEKRDKENVVVERTSVGVIHVFNKVGGEAFIQDDLILLQRMAMTAAAVLSSAQTYKGVARENQELLHTIDSLYAGLLMVSANGLILQINPSAREIMGIGSNAPLIGLSYHRAIPHNGVRTLLQQSLSAGGQEVADEIRSNVRQDEADGANSERVYQVQCTPVRDDNGDNQGSVAIFNDITEIRSVELMKTAFISTVSHELRTPLTSIKGFISTLLADKEGYYDEATKQEFYSIIDIECDRLTRLIKDLLDISRIEQGNEMRMYWDKVNVPLLVEKILAAQRAYTKIHTLSAEFPSDFPLIDADADKIDQILTNLVNNSIKYSPNGGKVVVSGRSVGDNGSHVLVRVSDDGMGISKENVPKLFDKFYRVDNRDNREIGGTGIGLALVKAYTEAHHGSVRVDTELGKGSAFTITIPIEQQDYENQSND